MQNASYILRFLRGLGYHYSKLWFQELPLLPAKEGVLLKQPVPEVVYVDPDSPEKIGEAILKVVNNKDLRDKMISIGTDYANNFRDDVIARAYMKLYHSLLK